MTELIWDGKYDQSGKRTAPLRVSLPFQTVESVNESVQQRQIMLDLFSAGRDPQWRNRLIWGDKKYVLPSLLDEFAGKVNLIYIDPPFNVGADFSFTATIPDQPDTDDDETAEFVKQPSLIEQKAYRDTWGKGMDSYLQWIYETLDLLKDLLHDDGSIYVHIDENASHYVKVILDQVFGPSSFRNEIIWKCTSAHSDSKRYGSNHQTIFFYTRGDKWVWNKPMMEYDEAYIEQYYRYKENNGRRFKSGDLSAFGLQGGGYTYEWHGHKKPWRVPIETMQRLDNEGKIFYTKNGVARLKSYLDEANGMPAQTIWTDKAVQYVVSWGPEKVTYSTQKSEGLLKRIISASSNENDLVLDCFSGSGTTAVVAEKLNRRWITCDLGRFAIHTTRKRLLGIEGIKPFVVQNLGKYERQAWQKDEFRSQNDEVRIKNDEAVGVVMAYRQFILNLYHARPINGYTWLHGVKGGHMVHVSGVDSPVTVGDVTAIVSELKRAVGSGENAPVSNNVDVLGWDFAFELNEVAKQQAAQANVTLRFLRVPRDVMDKRAVEQGDIHFFELAALQVETAVKKLELSLTLADFVIPPDDVPEEVQKSIKHWSQWVDYWAVDWDYKDDTFHNQWQTYRTRKNPDLQKAAKHLYETLGEYTVVVKVIDILGNDTTKAVKVKVG